MDIKEGNIQSFWQENPCGENLTGRKESWKEHFTAYDEFRYSTEGHILRELDNIDFQNRMVLEIGIGQAADSYQIAKRGAIWNGLDLTAAAVERARARFSLSDMRFGEVQQGSATAIPWPDNSFDIVYSHGVLHHIPEIGAVSAEISRVLKPGGKLVMMLYHKHSLNYYLSIGVIRRLGLLVLLSLEALNVYRPTAGSVFSHHINNAKDIGILKYLGMKTFIHHNTDGPQNPFARVYSRDRISIDFPGFDIERTAVHFLNSRHFPGIGLLPKRLIGWLDRRLGWHLWAILENRKF